MARRHFHVDVPEANMSVEMHIPESCQYTLNVVRTSHAVWSPSVDRSTSVCRNPCYFCLIPLWSREEFDQHIVECYEAQGAAIERVHGDRVYVQLFMSGGYYYNVSCIEKVCPRCQHESEMNFEFWEHVKTEHRGIVEFGCNLCTLKDHMYMPVLGHVVNKH